MYADSSTAAWDLSIFKLVSGVCQGRHRDGGERPDPPEQLTRAKPSRARVSRSFAIDWRQSERVVRRQFHRGIVRLVNLQAREQGTVCVNILSRFGTQLKRGAIVTVENERVRIRPAAPE